MPVSTPTATARVPKLRPDGIDASARKIARNQRETNECERGEPWTALVQENRTRCTADYS